jgi:ubiquinone/menaquinone biosynthesis C-methylase UbiE/uncharacterized protein YbaR (Trm112 family)
MPLPVSMKKLREQYRDGGNILQFLRDREATTVNSLEAVLASYDLQAGSYVEAMRKGAHRAVRTRYAAAIARLLDTLAARSILEAGVGEATTLAHVVASLQRKPRLAAGFDISWSRVACGRAYAMEERARVRLVVGDLFAIPVADNGVDVVYTSHSIEPNRGREKDALRELFRVARQFVVLLEPASTLGNAATRERILRHSYCSDLDRHARELGYRVAQHHLFDVSVSDTNQTELIVIEKQGGKGIGHTVKDWLACPCCRSTLQRMRGHYYCDECCLVFPVINQIPCLLPGSGILASKYPEF